MTAHCSFLSSRSESCAGVDLIRHPGDDRQAALLEIRLEQLLQI